MTKKNLILTKNTTKKIPSTSSNTEVYNFSEVKTWLKPKTMLNYINKYKEVTLLTYKIGLLFKPFLTILSLKLLCKGACTIEDDYGSKLKVTYPMLLKNFFNYIKDHKNTSTLLKLVKTDLEKLEIQYKTKRASNSIDFSNTSIYLRTDLCFGIISGGSIGHIAGVLNNLDNFTSPPIFISTDIISTVRKDIQNKIIQPNNEFANTNIELWTLNFNKIFYKKAFNYLQNIRPSFIYQRYSLNNFSGIKLAQHFKVPFILEYNGSEVWVSKNWGEPLKYEYLSEKIELLNANFADLIVVVSQPIKDELIQRGITSEKILVNPNGVNPDKYSPDIDGSATREKYQLHDKTVIGFIGTFGMWHGAEVLVESLGLLFNKHPEYKDKIRLLMIGDGIRMPQVKENIKKYNLKDYCILTGIIPQEEGPRYLAACDILGSPHVPNPDGTKFFGSPTKLFEYMAMGKSIVASDLDQIGEILEHNKTAYMVTPGNPYSFMEGLKALIDNKKLQQELGRNAREEVIRNYTWKKHTEKIINKISE